MTEAKASSIESKPSYKSKAIRKTGLLAVVLFFVVVAVLAGRLVVATHNATRFIEAIRSDDIQTINELYQSAVSGLTFKTSFPEFDTTSQCVLKPISIRDVIQGQRLMTIRPKGHLSAWPFYVSNAGVHEYESYVL